MQGLKLHPRNWEKGIILRLCLVIVLLDLVLCTASTDSLSKEHSGSATDNKKCALGEYLVDGRCLNCSICSEWEYTESECNATQNSVCKCISGYYRDQEDGQCKECQKCGVGWGASPACTATSNTVCVACPEGSYSSVVSSSKSCQSCRLCDPKNEIVINQCTSQKDTNCFKGHKRTQSDRGVADPQLCQGENCGLSEGNTYLYTAPLYCALLGSIILGLLIYVLLRCRVNKNRAAQLSSGNVSLKQPLNFHVTQQSLSPTSVTTPLVYLQDGSKTVAVTPSTKYKELSPQTRRAVARGLSQDGSWLKLAHNLGFTPSEISQIQSKAGRNHKGTSAATILLKQWTEHDCSSVGVISYALISINRLDLVHLIHSSNSMNGSEIV